MLQNLFILFPDFLKGCMGKQYTDEVAKAWEILIPYFVKITDAAFDEDPGVKFLGMGSPSMTL